MSFHDFRKHRADRGHTRSRGPAILRFEALEGRQVLSTLPGRAAAAADLVAQGIQTETFRDWGDSLQVQGNVLNQGNANVDGSFLVDVYVSPTKALGSGSVKLGTIKVEDGVKAGQTVALDQEFQLPSTAITGLGADQAIYIGLVVDAQNEVNESNETNNYNRGQGVDSALVLITPRAPAQLAPTSLTIDDSTPEWGDEISVTLRVANNQAGAASATRAILVLSPPGAQPGSGQDVTIADEIEVPAIGAYGTVEVTQTIKLPPGPALGNPTSGQYTVWVKTDADHATNPMLSPVLLQREGTDYLRINLTADSATGVPTPTAAPDLATSDVLTPGTPLVWGQPFQAAATVHNRSNVDSGPMRVRFLLGGPNGELNSALVLGDAIVENIEAGASETVVQNLKLPSKLPFDIPLGAGQGRIIAVVDPENRGVESDEANNIAQSGLVSLSLASAPTPTPPTTTPTPTNPPTTGTNNPRTPRTGTPQRIDRPIRTGTSQTAAGAASRAQRLQRLQDRKLQLQAMRNQLTQRQNAQLGSRLGQLINPNRPRVNAPSPDLNITLGPDS